MVRELAVPGAWKSHPSNIATLEGCSTNGSRISSSAALPAIASIYARPMLGLSAGVLRGLHFAELPPSQAKYVTCLRGSVFDVVVDIRVGSPTFGRWDSVLLGDRERRSVYISEGLAHGFLALQDDSTEMYLCSPGYAPDREHTIRPTDAALGIEWPDTASGPIVSNRDAEAPLLEGDPSRGQITPLG